MIFELISALLLVVFTLKKKNTSKRKQIFNHISCIDQFVFCFSPPSNEIVSKNLSPNHPVCVLGTRIDYVKSTLSTAAAATTPTPSTKTTTFTRLLCWWPLPPTTPKASLDEYRRQTDRCGCSRGVEPREKVKKIRSRLFDTLRAELCGIGKNRSFAKVNAIWGASLRWFYALQLYKVMLQFDCVFCRACSSLNICVLPTMKITYIKMYLFIFLTLHTIHKIFKQN